ncbi:hypothetical protein EVAR_20588_1 [Eumeta japonica]|uniref:Uncharacterized protein n=1 Tax=Eumeta variegata TaxID=151549 RepID=A0A4C1URZ2_EUMVA|nr:hypothetical protein EVAR_20588_1 [Eumeta japonica]
MKDCNHQCWNINTVLQIIDGEDTVFKYASSLGSGIVPDTSSYHIERPSWETREGALVTGSACTSCALAGLPHHMRVMRLSTLGRDESRQ